MSISISSSKPWQELQRNKDVDTSAVRKAVLKADEKDKEWSRLPEKSDSDELQRVMYEVSKAAEKSAKTCDRKSGAIAIKALLEIAKLAERRAKEIELESAKYSKRKEEDEEEEEDGEDEKYEEKGGGYEDNVGVLRSLMRQLSNNRYPFAFGLVSDKGPRYMLLHKTKQPDALAKELRGAGCKKVAWGWASSEGKLLNIDLKGPKISNLVMQVRGYLTENKMPCSKVQILEEGGEVLGEEEAEKKAEKRGGKQVEEETEEEVEEETGQEDEGGGTAEQQEGMVQPYSIGKSVGKGGANAYDDVMAVQTALNRQGASLDADGKYGPKTYAAIQAYQKKLGWANPDGLITPGKTADQALQGKKVKYAQGGGAYGQKGGGSYGTPPKGGYTPPKGGYTPPKGGYTPPKGGYTPPKGGYTPPKGGYTPPKGGYTPPKGQYPPPKGEYPPPGGYPPTDGGYGKGGDEAEWARRSHEVQRESERGGGSSEDTETEKNVIGESEIREG